MKSYLKALEGLTVAKVIEEYDCSLLFAEKDVTLTVSTKVNMSDGSNVRSLQGSKVEKVEETEDAATLYLSDDRRLRIDLSDEAYEGPEALALHRQGEPIVVWN